MHVNNYTRKIIHVNHNGKHIQTTSFQLCKNVRQIYPRSSYRNEIILRDTDQLNPNLEESCDPICYDYERNFRTAFWFYIHGVFKRFRADHEFCTLSLQRFLNSPNIQLRDRLSRSSYKIGRIE